MLIVGHSNTVDDVVNKLCGEIKVPADLPDSEYDNLYLVIKKGKKMKEKIILRILKIEKKRSFIYLVLETLSNYLQNFYSMQYLSF